MNQSQVASSICVFHTENVAAPASVLFRVQAGVASDDVERPGLERRRRLISMYAIDDVVDCDGQDVIPHMQELGSVSVSEGRVITFPNTLQYRISPIELRDPLRPGHVRFPTLCLADPNYHVVSTKRVVP